MQRDIPSTVCCWLTAQWNTLKKYNMTIISNISLNSWWSRLYERFNCRASHWPFLDFAAVVSEGDGHGVDIVRVKCRVKVMEVRGHPADPHIKWLLAGENPHWVIILETQRSVVCVIGWYLDIAYYIIIVADNYCTTAKRWSIIHLYTPCSIICITLLHSKADTFCLYCYFQVILSNLDIRV